MAGIRQAVVINSRCNHAGSRKTTSKVCDMCGYEVFEEDDECPCCGEPVRKTRRTKKQSSYAGGVFFLVILVFIVIWWFAR